MGECNDGVMDDQSGMRWWLEVGQYEQEQREEEDTERANELAALARDEQYREELEAKYPYLRSW
jgi:hypothetical protein